MELFNNYGPKPNAELILGYGFSLPDNPDDTIVLKIGSRGFQTSSGAVSEKQWEVGRDARGAESVFSAVLEVVSPRPEQRSIEDELDAAAMLEDMALSLFERLPGASSSELRPEVALMLEHYLEGQRDIITALIVFAHEKETKALQIARDQGKVFCEGDELEQVQEDEEE
ncbi:hypothetical protein A0H81_05302 [Grifola frondosa]|uniref:Uncharacterized protein n=1 Tax=Grifola frondosa TaxID=5627 RepID=A0A1C7MBN5_GRIFR|nr:hypothetical protein A0H81_05302 [Grifola frondosa]